MKSRRNMRYSRAECASCSLAAAPDARIYAFRWCILATLLGEQYCTAFYDLTCTAKINYCIFEYDA